MKRVLVLKFLLFTIIFWSCNQRKMVTDFEPKEGDLLFQDLDCGPLCDAIEAVTKGYNGANLSHMGLVVSYQDSGLYVLEAISTGIVETPIDEFLGRSRDSEGNPKVIVARTKKRYKHLIPLVLSNKDKYLGLPYNNEYLLNDSSYYCSQLIYTLFKNANYGNDFFILFPMTFKEPNSEQFFDAWIKYYKDLNCNIPEGMPGLNPGGMSRSDKIKIIRVLGRPDGMN